MKVIIAGSRYLSDPFYVHKAMVLSGLEPSLVIQGGEPKGVDALAKKWAIERGIPFETFEANWTRYGGAAGPIRNGEMAQAGDVLVAIVTASSTGTLDMIAQMRKLGKPVFQYKLQLVVMEE